MYTPQECPKCKADLSDPTVPTKSRCPMCSRSVKGVPRPHRLHRQLFTRAMQFQESGHWMCPDCGHVWEAKVLTPKRF